MSAEIIPFRGLITSRAKSFLAANEESPVVYGSVSENGVTYRLANGKVFNLSRNDCAHAGAPRWAHQDPRFYQIRAARLEREMHSGALEEYEADNAEKLAAALQETNA